jgi:hypothetical protein
MLGDDPFAIMHIDRYRRGWPTVSGVPDRRLASAEHARVRTTQPLVWSDVDMYGQLPLAPLDSVRKRPGIAALDEP